MSAGAVASIIGVALLIVFMAQNSENVRLDFLAWSFTWPLWVVCLLAAIIGALVWFGLGVVRRRQRRMARRA